MRLRFADCAFDEDTREVFREGRSCPVSPKAFALLALLIERRPGAVSREDIHAQLWPDVHVSEANLANLVVELRSALGDNARKPRLIRTVPRFGYAFSGDARPDHPRREPATGAPRLVYRLVWGRREISLDPGENLIGRDREAAVWIDDDSVSRRHARVSVDDDGATIEDLGSKNGTYVGDRKIKGPARLSDRDIVRVGPATLKLRVFKRTGSTLSTVKERSSK